MSREEAIEILSDMRAEYNLFGDEEEATRYHVLSWAIQAMKDTQRWIPISERLPEPNSAYKDVLPYYLVQNEYGDMMVATFIKSNGEARVWQQIYQYGEIMDEIVAWMPLPDPWKGAEHENQ